MVVVVDYGAGNLGSVLRALGRLDVATELTADPLRIRDAQKLILPGVGHFGEAMNQLRARGLESVVRAAVARGAHLLGICVGFQMLFETSEEAPGVGGLGLLPGRVRRFQSLPDRLPVPHVGWNEARQRASSPLFEGVAGTEYFYFLHSYYVETEDDVALATTDYGLEFCSVGGRGRLAGIQFHPEKSQQAGLQVLRNFCRAS